MPDVSAFGGVAETLAIGDVAAERGTRLTLHSSSSVVLFLASLHAAAAHRATHSVEMHMMHDWIRNLAPSAHRVHDGAVRLGDAPGLGVDAADLVMAFEARGENRTGVSSVDPE